jgi:hypothetical protein
MAGLVPATHVKPDPLSLGSPSKVSRREITKSDSSFGRGHRSAARTDGDGRGKPDTPAILLAGERRRAKTDIVVPPTSASPPGRNIMGVHHQGSCLCGAVTVEVSAEPIAVAICHCRNCQKQTGSAFSTVILAPAAAVTINGTLSEFGDRSAAGTSVTRRFCGRCGSPIQTESAGTIAQGITVIKAGILDSAGSLKPSLQIFCDSAQGWVPEVTETARFGKMPPR